MAKDDNDALEQPRPDQSGQDQGPAQRSDRLPQRRSSAKAPKDIEATTKALLAAEEKLESLLKANDFDFVKMAASDEGKKLIDDASITKAGDDLDKYLSDKCGIAHGRFHGRHNARRYDDPAPLRPLMAPLRDSRSISATGDDAINKFLDFYELGTGSKLTDEQRNCIVSNLSGKISGDDLNEAISTGKPSDAVSLALGQAFITCNVATQS